MTSPTTDSVEGAPAVPRRRSAVRARWLAVLRTPVGAGAGLLLALVLLLAVFAPLLWSDRAETFDTGSVLQGASADHWVGTDNLGRDLFYRVLVATRLSIGLALMATSIAVVIGLVLGTAPLLLGRRAGRLVTAGVNIAVAFPGLLLALFFAVVFGVGMTGAVLAIGFAGAPAFARLTHTLAAGIAERDFVAAARIAGVGRTRLLLRHVLPNIGEPLVVNATIGAGGALLAFAGLSFLGLGVQAPSYDWGRLLQDGLSGIYIHPEAALAPGVAIVVAGLAFNLFGEAVAKGIGLTATVGGGFGPAAGRSPDRVSAAPTDDGRPATDPGRAEGRPVLDVQDLSVSFPGPNGPVRPVRGVSFRIGRGEAVGVVGESGSGKSLTALAIARLVERPGVVDAGRLEFMGTDVLAGSDRSHRRLLGTAFAMVFQDPMTSFNPTRRIGRQLAEVAEQHQGMNRRQAFGRAVDRLRSVRVPAAERRAHQYPHEFSGGMRQRAMIGMGLMGEPSLIVADEPTTALDVTVQRQVLDLLESVRAADDVALLLISHDVAVVGQVCDRVLVMYAGRVVEDLPAAELRTGARHPYTRALVATVPDMHVDLDQPLPTIPGRPVDPASQPPGCAYAPRCPLASARCVEEDPALADDGAGRRVACWHAGEIGTDTDVPGAAPVALTSGERA
ncbi:dipeptide/oligopeptide/nickel ABC transporter permease/ATP-binding protein [Blastococcus xanthinilyticus]|uniref:Oligopeptide/dipeptide ABC transporter ATP-binding protein n=1 Tax=Blastococcus xanthinilyticus TaxID=1564164 RepID=A0A5S5D3W4_9ACTN|nr:dipeptide/oligopeptide/nickel ABC transporter permease/ATP-binding protein [Blastococcus xanthinilyticus]TYP90415.1 oligopeptide/dipeptide ABC transporter ATP-binding protein [Blastococcus xanthinilyticus]